jgi:hypothetical protein
MLTRTSSRVKNIELVRNKALDKLKDQAQTMLNRNKKAINALNVDDIVRCSKYSMCYSRKK